MLHFAAKDKEDKPPEKPQRPPAPASPKPGRKFPLTEREDRGFPGIEPPEPWPEPGGGQEKGK